MNYERELPLKALIGAVCVLNVLVFVSPQGSLRWNKTWKVFGGGTDFFKGSIFRWGVIWKAVCNITWCLFLMSVFSGPCSTLSRLAINY